MGKSERGFNGYLIVAVLIFAVSAWLLWLVGDGSVWSNLVFGFVLYLAVLCFFSIFPYRFTRFIAEILGIIPGIILWVAPYFRASSGVVIGIWSIYASVLIAIWYGSRYLGIPLGVEELLFLSLTIASILATFLTEKVIAGWHFLMDYDRREKIQSLSSKMMDNKRIRSALYFLYFVVLVGTYFIDDKLVASSVAPSLATFVAWDQFWSIHDLGGARK